MKPLTGQQLAQHYNFINPLEWTIKTQNFGVNKEYYEHLGIEGHDGLDLRARTPLPCYAVCDGEIAGAGFDATGGGLVKIMTDPKIIDGQSVQLEILYYHLSSVSVTAGKRVMQGDQIAFTGNTGGLSTGPHLHFAIRPYYDGKVDWNNGFRGKVDPEPFIIERYPVDGYYNKRRNWILEYTFRFANAPEGAEVTPFLQERIEAARYVHRRLAKERRNPPLLTDREANAIIYGSWDLEFVLKETNFDAWSQMTKAEYLKKLGR